MHAIFTKHFDIYIIFTNNKSKLETFTMKNFISILLLSVFSFHPILAQEEGAIRNYIQIGKSDGISNNNIRSVQDDIYNRIWIGTEMGLNIYSNNSLTQVEHFSDMNVCSLFDTGTEMLIGTHNFLEAYNYTSGTYTRIKYNGYEITYAFSILKVKERIIIISSGFAYAYHDNQVELIKDTIPCHYVAADKFGTLWGYNEDTIYRFDDQFNIVKTYKLNSPDKSPLIVGCIYPDSKGCIWLGTEKDGLFRYNRVTDEFYKEDLSQYGVHEMGYIGSIGEDKYDRLWIGHRNGLSVYDYTNNYFKYYMLENSFNIQLITIITHIFRTKKQDMVLGTHFTGFFVINELNSSIKFYNLTEFNNQTGGITSNGITIDNQKHLWAATNCMGISVLDKKGKILKQINQKNSGINNDILSLEYDKKGNIWAGSSSAGLYKIDKTYKINRYIHQNNDTTSLAGRSVHAIYAINQDSLMIATNKGLSIYHYSTNSFTNILTAKVQDYAFTNLLPYKNRIYGVHFNSVFCFDRDTKQIKEYNLLKYNVFLEAGYIDKNGKLWLGSSKGELYLFENGKLTLYLKNKERIERISNILGDSLGNLWITSCNSFYCITPTKEVKHINLSWGLGDNEFNVRSCYMDENRFYFGTSNGLVGFNPLQIISQEAQSPSLYIADFKLFNKIVEPGKSNVLTHHINHTDKLILENKENYISFVINCIDYNINRIIPYKCIYQLENFNDNWYELNSASNEIIFTQLTTGNYKLHIRLQNDNGMILTERTIDIKIKPPFLLSTPMLTLYILILIIIIGWIRHIVRKRHTTKELIAKVKRENDEITRINAMKLDFFTFISHEFKTPLAIISTLQDEVLPPTFNSDDDAAIFKRNIKRLEYLINQLMEFRNMESEHTSIDLKKYDIVPFLKGIYDAFAPLYKQKEIDNQFICDTDTLPMLFDTDKMEMLIGNLLSNVAKHTQQAGQCYMKITTTNSHLTVDIFNSGECLTEEQKTAIFQPYNRTNIYSNSGIGLAIVNSIAKLLNIRVSVIAIENEGNIFRTEIPIIQNDNIEISSTNNHTNIVDRIIDDTRYFSQQTGTIEPENEIKNQFQILVVDNDNDTKTILKKKLQKYFHILTASSGKEALLLLKSQNVDIVISDIIMPEIDGYELCKTIKGNTNTKHVPVILITSDLSAEAKIKGFQSGADAFLSKPISIQELLLRLDNILKNKNVLRAYYSNFNQLSVEPEAVNNADEAFIHEITEYIYTHLNDAELSIQQLAQHVSISRTQLYLNIKRLTGYTPSQFMLNIKMKEAKKLIQNTDMTSSEISYKLGYCNPNHFSRQFKEYYGSSPSEFRKQS